MAKTKTKSTPSPYPHIEVRMEFRGGSSKKFYLINWNGEREQYQITYGRIGTAGATIDYEPDKALKKYEEKRKEGYQIVGKTATVPEFELPARAKARFDHLADVTLEQLLARHGHKVVKFHDVSFLTDGADILGVPPLPKLEAWLTRLGPDGVYKVREVLNQIGHDEDEEPSDEQKMAAFRLLLAVSDLV
jgi:predicted DNA-binding WGR domain protein